MSPRRQQGFVLVIVLWVLAILSVVTIGFGQRSLLDRRAARYALDHTQAMMAAQGAVQRGIVELQNKALPNNLHPEESMLTHLGQRWAQHVNLLEDEAYFEPGPGFENDEVYYAIEDNERRININTAPEEILKEIEGLSRPALRSIVKRRTPGGNPEDAPTLFTAPEELRYERGISDDEWFGRRGKPGLKDIITTSGNGKINVNTAPAEVLACFPNVNDQSVDAIVSYRNGPDGEQGTEDDQGFKTFEQLSSEAGIEGDALIALQTFGKLTSNSFIVRGIATRRQGAVRATCAATVQVMGTTAILTGWREERLGP